MTDEAQTDSEAHRILQRAFAHLRDHWRTLCIAALLWVMVAVVSAILMPNPAEQGRWLLRLALIVLGLWASIPVLVFAHRLVLFGPENAPRGVPWRWGTTEWEFFANGILVGLAVAGVAVLCAIPLGIIAVIVMLLIGAGADGGGSAGAVGGLLSVPIVLSVFGLSMLSAPLVVLGRAKPIRTSWKIIWRRKWLALNLLFVYAVVSLVMFATNWIATRLGVPLVAGLINAFLGAALGIAVATGLSFLYLHVRDDIPPSPAADAAAAVT